MAKDGSGNGKLLWAAIVVCLFLLGGITNNLRAIYKHEADFGHTGMKERVAALKETADALLERAATLEQGQMELMLVSAAIQADLHRLLENTP